MRDGRHLEGTVYALVAQAVPDAFEGTAIEAAVHLRADLGLDSLKLAGLLFRLAERLGGDPDDLIEVIGDDPILTVGDLVALGAKLEGSRA